MKKIFIEAHKMTKEMVEKYGVDYQAQLGLCISYLLENKEEEGMKELKGSEKQVKWANEIREKQMKEFYEWKEKWEAKFEGNKTELAEIKKYTELLENIEDAGKWITIEKQSGLCITHLINPKRRNQVLRYFNSYEIF